MVNPGSPAKVFDKISTRKVMLFDVLIKSYVNNHWFDDSLLLFKVMVNGGGCSPDHDTYPCVLKACFCSDNLSFKLQVHKDLPKDRLDFDLFVRSGLIPVYRKYLCLLEARRVLLLLQVSSGDVI
ncbi:hypothetical protein HN51_028473 [Arachis hypogaea]|nr:Putative pentatricopeptide repeat-containing protein [Arachis hypogaea]